MTPRSPAPLGAERTPKVIITPKLSATSNPVVYLNHLILLPELFTLSKPGWFYVRITSFHHLNCSHCQNQVGFMSAVTTTICDSFPDVEKKLIAKVLHFDVFQSSLKKGRRSGDDTWRSWCSQWLKNLHCTGLLCCGAVLRIAVCHPRGTGGLIITSIPHICLGRHGRRSCKFFWPV